MEYGKEVIKDKGMQWSSGLSFLLSIYSDIRSLKVFRDNLSFCEYDIAV